MDLTRKPKKIQGMEHIKNVVLAYLTNNPLCITKEILEKIDETIREEESSLQSRNEQKIMKQLNLFEEGYCEIKH